MPVFTSWPCRWGGVLLWGGCPLDDLKEGGGVAGEFGFADAVDGKEFFHVPWAPDRHVDQGAIGENEVGGNTGAIGQFPAVLAQALEQCLVVGLFPFGARGDGEGLAGVEMGEDFFSCLNASGFWVDPQAAKVRIVIDQSLGDELAGELPPQFDWEFPASAVTGEAIVMFAGDAMGTRSAQDLDDVGGPEKLAGLEDAGEEQPGGVRHVRGWYECELTEAMVAVSAGVGWLTEIGEERLAPAVLGISVCEHGLEAGEPAGSFGGCALADEMADG